VLDPNDNQIAVDNNKNIALHVEFKLDLRDFHDTF
jgi:hypothetical protein